MSALITRPSSRNSSQNRKPTPYEINVRIEDTGIFNVGVTEDAARKVTEVLQDNLDRHHINYNMMGFHNHIVHHILTIFALGATADQIQATYTRDSSYQKPARRVDETIVEALYDKRLFMEYLQNAQNYPNFLSFFQREIYQKGVDYVLNEYLFQEDERANEMLLRMFTGLLHPIIHLGFGIEFNQPAIVAEGLAQACLDPDWIGLRTLLPQAEQAAGGVGQLGTKSLYQLLDEIQEDEELSCSQKAVMKKIQGVVTSRPDEAMLKHISQFKVAENQMDEKIAEMMNAVVYYTAAAEGSQKFDFVCLHAVNSSIFFSSLLALPFLSLRAQLRLLEWKGRMDMMVYREQGAAPLALSSITENQIRKDWPAIFDAACLYGDDGHTAKFIRAVAHAKKVCGPYEARKDWKISGNMWLKIANMKLANTWVL